MALLSPLCHPEEALPTRDLGTENVAPCPRSLVGRASSG
jgi:hypothetical protein